MRDLIMRSMIASGAEHSKCGSFLSNEVRVTRNIWAWRNLVTFIPSGHIDCRTKDMPLERANVFAIVKGLSEQRRVSQFVNLDEQYQVSNQQ